MSYYGNLIHYHKGQSYRIRWCSEEMFWNFFNGQSDYLQFKKTKRERKDEHTKIALLDCLEPLEQPMV